MKIALFVVLLSFLTGCYSVTNWDGGFETREFEFQIVDETGNPVEGVTLAVYDASGQKSFDFPLDEFKRNGTLVSDERGVIFASHQSSGIEFWGSCKNYIIFNSRKCDYSPPEFSLEFIYKGNLIEVIKYSEINISGRDRVKRVITL